MCGICGFVGFNDFALLKEMSKLQQHRGPDNEGFFVDKNVSLANQRLSIIDLKKGNQPIFNEDKSIVVVFNGEIFNFKELRKQIESKGHKFYTNSDTEVLVHLYEDYGENFLKKINGQFAFALFDSKKKTLLIARDRFGIKPLFYSIYGDSFFFASEIMSLTIVPDFEKELDLNALNDYFTFGYILSPKTIFSKIRKLPAGHFLKIADGKFFEKKYFDLKFDSSKFEGKQIAVKKVEQFLENAVERQLVSDVPVGVFLSGGIDSSAITFFSSKFIKNLNTFSIGFNEQKYNELSKARLVAETFGTNHHEAIVTEKDFDILPFLMERFGEPFFDSSCIPTNAVAALARKHVKVVLAGDGGDEIFAGYSKFDLMAFSKNLQPFLDIARNCVPKPLIGFGRQFFPKHFVKAKRFFGYCSKSPAEMYFAAQQCIQDEEKKALISDSKIFRNNYNPRCSLENYSKLVSKSEGLNNVLFQDIKVYLTEDILVKTDRMTMNNSLEARVPFLDNFLADYSATIPFNFKLRYGEKKFILKKALEKRLPKKILLAKKQGFGIPLPEWVYGNLNERINSLFDNNTELQKFFEKKELQKIIAKNATPNNCTKAWILLAFAVWHKIFIEEISPKKVF